jgi:hypothetical protein
LVPAGSGCSSTEKIRLTESGVADFQQLNIVYDVTSNTRVARLDEPLGVRPAGLSESSHPDPPANIHLRLEVVYPYPGVHAYFVHATLSVVPAGSSGPKTIAMNNDAPAGLRGFSNANSRGGGLMSGTVGPPVNRVPKAGEELLVIDLPKTELNALFVDLANDGFFSKPSVKEGEAHLEVTYNQGQVDKVWTREPRLEKLVELLKRRGTPTFSQQPASGPHPGYYTGRTGKT